MMYLILSYLLDLDLRRIQHLQKRQLTTTAGGGIRELTSPRLDYTVT